MPSEHPEVAEAGDHGPVFPILPQGLIQHRIDQRREGQAIKRAGDQSQPVLRFVKMGEAGKEREV